MASFTTVGDTLELLASDVGETIAVAISGTYNMVIDLQVELGSVGSGAWRTVKSWNTANATVAYDHVTTHYNENVRLFLRTDTSGTATVTLTDTSDLVKKTITDGRGTTLAEFKQSGLVLHGGAQRTSGGIVSIAASTTLDAATHAGKICVTDIASTITITLPAATGTGNTYTLFTGTTATGNHVYQVANATDSFGGGVSISTDIAGVTELAVAGDDTITLNGSTTGGLVGSWVQFTDVKAGMFMVNGFLASSGAEASCFSAAVS